MPPVRKGKASGMPKKSFVIKKMTSPIAARSPAKGKSSRIWLFRSKYAKDNHELNQVKGELTGNHFVACLPSAQLKNDEVKEAFRQNGLGEYSASSCAGNRSSRSS